MSRQVCTALIAASALLGCGSSGDESTGPSAAGIRLVAGADVTDTIEARPLQALVVEVRSAGKIQPGVIVRFESLPSADTTRRYEAAISVSKVAQNYFSAFTSDTTNASGRASALVQLGTVAGDARLLVTCPELGFADTARYTVRPGLAAKLVVSVRDTSVRTGGTYSIGAAVSDRAGNRRSDAVTYASRSALATVDASGKVQVGQEIGRGTIAVSAGGAVDSASFSVIPLLNLMFMYTAGGSAWIAEGLSDGSGVRQRLRTPSPAYPSPSPTSDQIAFQRIDYEGKVYILDTSGEVRELVDSTVINASYYPRFTADGQFIYFSGRDATGYAVWRVRPDGTALTRITATGFGFTTPGVSLDGSRIAYSDDNGLVLLTLATGAKKIVGAPGWFPVFSPDGRRLAYFSGYNIIVANADGTSAAPLSVPIGATDAGLSWLPDSKWLITRDFFVPVLVNASTSERMPLTAIPGYYQITAKP